MNDVIVKRSEIHGKGVFAARDFRKGEIVIRWDISHRISKKQYERLSRKDKGYVAHIGRIYILQQSPAKYVNHSCNHNTYVRKSCDVAKRNIKKGEEITANYGDDTENLNMKCSCGSKNCRKIIRN